MTMRVATRRALLYPKVETVGWWNDDGAISGAIGAWRAIGAASLAASYVDLSGTSNDLTVGTAPTWASGTGWTGGSSAYLKTGIAMGAAYTAIVRVSGWDLTSLQDVFGAYGPVAINDRFIVVSSTEQIFIGYGDDGAANYTPGSDITGVMALSAENLYEDGSFVLASTGTFTGTSPELYLMAGNENGTAGSFYTADLLAASIYNVELSATDVATISTAMAALT